MYQDLESNGENLQGVFVKLGTVYEDHRNLRAKGLVQFTDLNGENKFVLTLDMDRRHTHKVGDPATVIVHKTNRDFALVKTQFENDQNNLLALMGSSIIVFMISYECFSHKERVPAGIGLIVVGFLLTEFLFRKNKYNKTTFLEGDPRLTEWRRALDP